MTDEILDDVKMLLKLTDGAQDETLRFYIEDVADAITAYCRLEFLPKQLYGLTAQITVSLYNRSGSEAAAITEGARRIEFIKRAPSVIEEYYERLKPFMNRAGLLPSEVVRHE